MFDSLLGLLILIGIVALIVVALRQNNRIRVLEQEIGVRQEGRVRLLEREMGALRSFVLSAPTGPASAAEASDDAETSTAYEVRSAAALKQDSDGVSAEDVAARAADADETQPVALSKAVSANAASADATSAPQPADLAPELAAARDAGGDDLAGGGSQNAASSVAAGVFPAAKKGPDIETALGTRWAVWVGGVALALGGIFLVRYTIEAGWFGPGARLTLAGLFGLILIAAGEYIRRTGFRVPLEGIANAYIPAILTAAGAFSLFGTVYAAHAIYGFIGAGPAFVLLGVIGVATMALALIHGQALAGIGLLGSLVTPILVSSDSPKPWVLFGYLAIVLIATIGISRIRRWRFLASAAFFGVGLWTLVYIVAGPVEVNVVAFISAVTLACFGSVWCKPTDERRAAVFPSIMPAFFVGLVSAGLMADPAMQLLGSIWPGAALMIAMVAIAVWRAEALALLYGAGVFTALVFLQLGLAGVFEFEVMGEAVIVDGFAVDTSAGLLFYPGVLLALVFFAVGVWQARRHVAATQKIAASWAAFAVLVPLIVVCAFWLALGDPNIDVRYAIAALALTVAIVADGEVVARDEEPPLDGGVALSILLAGAGAALIAALHMGFGPGLTTIFCGAAAVLPALATRYRSYPVLGPMSVAAVIMVLARVAIDPTIVGAAALGRTPVFNELLAGYGIPALAFAFCAWRLARGTDLRLAMEASAIFFALLTAAMLVRHAMHGGVIDSSEPTLAEQAIYSMIGLAAGGIMISLDLRSPSSVLRYGSLSVGVLSVAAIAIQHFVTLNPLFTNELTGQIPVFNLLFLAYLLPAIAAGALALYARGKRPKWYSAMLALTASVLAFAYATLSVRRLFWGEYLGAWHGLEPLETYSYSALWLAMGVVLLVIGVRTGSFVIRAASAVVIAATVAKVFLFDMSELEGFLRALSFIGLGAVLIGIGLFYQRLLTRSVVSDALLANLPEPKEESGR